MGQDLIKFSLSVGHKVLSRESNILEFKESFNWNSKDRYAKSIAAFSNNRGGSIVFGVKDKPRNLVGLQSDNFELFDEAIITQYLNSVLSPEIEFEKFVKKARNKIIGILQIYQARQKPVVVIKNDGELKEGEIYHRYNARNDKIKFPELRLLLDQIKENERKHWMELFEKISKIGPENTAIMDVINGKIEGKFGTLIIDHKLIPKLKFIQEGRFTETGKPTLKLIGEVKPVSIVGTSRILRGSKMRITDDPNAPEFRINEDNMLKEFSLDYKKLTDNLNKRYSDFKSNAKYHKIRKELMLKGFSYTRKLNPKNEKSTKQDFYSPRIYKEFDRHYRKKSKK